MALKIINVTSLKLAQKLEKLRLIYPSKINHPNLNEMDWRQKLIHYVLNRMTNCYLVLDVKNIPQALSEIELPNHEDLQMENLIHQGICYFSLTPNSSNCSYTCILSNSAIRV